jgi:hypothetical protein
MLLEAGAQVLGGSFGHHLCKRTAAVHGGACTPLTVTVIDPGLPGVEGVAG